jgi:hypothetical protein
MEYARVRLVARRPEWLPATFPHSLAKRSTHYENASSNTLRSCIGIVSVRGLSYMVYHNRPAISCPKAGQAQH